MGSSVPTKKVTTPASLSTVQGGINEEESMRVNEPVIDEEAVAILKAFCKLTEGCSLTAYKDPNSADGLPITIAFGATRTFNNQLWRLGDTVTQSQAEELLRRDIKDALEVAADIPNWESLSAGQKAALADLTYNTGYRYQDGRHDTLDRLLFNRNWNDVPKQLLAYRDKGTSVELGVARRRYAEGLLWKGWKAEDAYHEAWGMSLDEILEG